MVDVDVTTVPNAARVYDYMLGGEHNYEPDRLAAEYMGALVPSTRNWLRKLRGFLHHATVKLGQQGFDRFLDLGSGLPTKEHIHASVPNAKVVYVDNDPVVVAFGTQILGSNPNARYLEADIRNITTILESPEALALVSDARKLAIGFNAVSCFLNDQEIQQILRALHDFAPLGSKLFATFETKALNGMTPKMRQFIDMFDKLGSPYHFLTLEKSKELTKPWVEDENGFRPLFEWLSEEKTSSEDSEGVDLEFYGVILVKT